jgi:TetR/AcrR family transcriptional regulator, transcriptional repressor for nem operon
VNLDTRSHILKESVKLFLRKGYKDVTLNEILTKTGLSKGAFYYYFKTKEQLFLEIIESYFSYMVVYKFENYSNNSLKEFYNDHLKDLAHAVGRFTSDKARIGSNNGLSTNYLYPVFDALRILPEFRISMKEARDKEIYYWTSAVARARESGEINSKMTDEQIGKIFIYTGNSIGLQLIMEEGSMSTLTSKFKDFWDNFYESLKA